MRELDKSFGEALRKRRQQLGLSQEELNFRTGVHRTFISEIERGVKSPTLHTVAALAEALGIKPSDLMRMAEECETKAPTER
ncbi:MAG: helix-turn-helix transcriptional regulator [Chloroflexi bacterium]|nr:helix-turn-helix transcriptional regulator [Chloroflexota bacterium]